MNYNDNPITFTVHDSSQWPQTQGDKQHRHHSPPISPSTPIKITSIHWSTLASKNTPPTSDQLALIRYTQNISQTHQPSLPHQRQTLRHIPSSIHNSTTIRSTRQPVDRESSGTAYWSLHLFGMLHQSQQTDHWRNLSTDRKSSCGICQLTPSLA